MFLLDIVSVRVGFAQDVASFEAIVGLHVHVCQPVVSQSLLVAQNLDSCVITGYVTSCGATTEESPLVQSKLTVLEIRHQTGVNDAGEASTSECKAHLDSECAKSAFSIEHAFL